MAKDAQGHGSEKRGGPVRMSWTSSSLPNAFLDADDSDDSDDSDDADDAATPSHHRSSATSEAPFLLSVTTASKSPTISCQTAKVSDDADPIRSFVSMPSVMATPERRRVQVLFTPALNVNVGGNLFASAKVLLLLILSLTYPGTMLR